MNPEQWLSLKWNGGSTMSDRWLNQSKIIHFTYLYDEEKDSWRLSPAYDLTYSSTYYGEHTTTVDGNGRNPGRKEILTVGITAGMKKEVCVDIMDQIEKCVRDMLGEYL